MGVWHNKCKILIVILVEINELNLTQMLFNTLERALSKMAKYQVME